MMEGLEDVSPEYRILELGQMTLEMKKMAYRRVHNFNYTIVSHN